MAGYHNNNLIPVPVLTEWLSSWCVVISGGSRTSQREWGVNSKGEDANLLFGQFFPKNCMKMKEIRFGPIKWGCASLAAPPGFTTGNGFCLAGKGAISRHIFQTFFERFVFSVNCNLSDCNNTRVKSLYI